MYLPLGQYSPDIKLGFVSASRNCFPRPLAAERSEKLIAATKAAGIELTVPVGECAVIETRTHAADAAKQLIAAGCDAAVLFLGNFSPEIEDAAFVKAFPGPVLLIAAAEESAINLIQKRGDALCGDRRGVTRDIRMHSLGSVDIRQLSGCFVDELIECGRFNGNFLRCTALILAAQLVMPPLQIRTGLREWA